MKKINKILALILSLMIMFSVIAISAVPAASAANPVAVTVRINDKQIRVNNSYNANDYTMNTMTAAPILYGGYTMIPVRAVIQALKGTVNWYENATPNYAICTYNNVTVKVTIGSAIIEITKNGKTTTSKMKTTAKLIGSTSYMPVRGVCEAMDCGVYYKEINGGPYVVVTQAKTTDANVNTIASFPINWGWPIEDNLGTITHPYGCTCGAHPGHNGVDIPISGKNVVAIEYGQVLKLTYCTHSGSCSTCGGAGTSVRIKHANGMISWYCHLKSGSVASLTEGQFISKGQLIGIVGSTGNSTGDHLHLAMYSGNYSYVNPQNYIKK